MKRANVAPGKGTDKEKGKGKEKGKEMAKGSGAGIGMRPGSGMSDDDLALAAAADAAAAEPPPAPPQPAPTAAQIAQRAAAFEQRLARLSDEVDPSWQRAFAARAPALALLGDNEGRQALALAGVLRRFCGSAPALDRLAAEAAQVALMSPPVVLRALGLLALARRPGALRCCVDRGQKELLQQALGPAVDALETFGDTGRPVSHEAGDWTPLHWSCLGYLDWAGLLAREDGFLRRLVRLLLPRGLLDMPQRLHLARPDLPSREALTRLAAAGVPWPC